jgi:hypothetical protein
MHGEHPSKKVYILRLSFFLLPFPSGVQMGTRLGISSSFFFPSNVSCFCGIWTRWVSEKEKKQSVCHYIKSLALFRPVYCQIERSDGESEGSTSMLFGLYPFRRLLRKFKSSL